LSILGLDEWTFRRRIAVDRQVGGSGHVEPKSLVYPGRVDSTSIRAHREKLEKLLREGLDVQWEQALCGLEQPFEEVLDVEKLRIERVPHWLMLALLISHGELRALADKSVFFMGDSAHAKVILGGEGANNAMTNGVELAECISTSSPGDILSWYEAKYPA
jgi:2-polyprenyl-6-methoxyphenol hydroxylase-like FAD-dependent oxidoreductase